MPNVYLQVECDEHKGDDPCLVSQIGHDYDTPEEAKAMYEKVLAALTTTHPAIAIQIDQLDGEEHGW